MASFSDTGNGYMARIEELSRRADNADRDREKVWKELREGGEKDAVIENEIKHLRGDVNALGKKLTTFSRWLAGACLSFTALAVAVVATFS